MISKQLLNISGCRWAPMAIILLVLMTPANAGAKQTWSIDAENCEIKFVASKFEEPLQGSFKSFEVESGFDLDTPESSYVRIEIDMGSVSTGNKKIDELLKQPDWFSIQSHPIAVFESSKFTKIVDKRYAIEGTITLKGKTEKLALEATVEIADDPADAGRIVAKANSEIAIKRMAFSVGAGPWADLGAIADEVKVSVKLSASRSK
jgi:polyisoprenoid-binding protein YceI